MGALRASPNQALLAGETRNAQARRKQKAKEKRNIEFEPKDEFDPLDEASCSRKEKHQRFDKGKFSHCKKGNHTEKYCMKKTIDHMEKILEKHNIALPESTRKTDTRENTEYHDEICHALNDSCSKSHVFLIDSGASNHKVASRESFSSLQLTDPSIHMGDHTQIRAEGKGSIKLKHGVFKDVLYVPSLAANLLYVYQMTHTGPPKRVVFGPDSVEI